MKKMVFFIIMSAVNINSSFAGMKSLADIIGVNEQYLSNAYIQGTTFTSYPDSDDADEQYYGIADNNTFAVEYKNNKGIITGTAKCVDQTENSGSTISTSTSLSNTVGKNCWCSLDGYKVSGKQPKTQASDTIWVFATIFNSNEHCEERCVTTCVHSLSDKSNANLRSALFSVTTVEYKGPTKSAAVTEIDNWINVTGNNKSKWKDAAGNFNTSRLASDLTAGVVLGTVGGVVSGVVIKKKQVEKGFDALNCYVGGQKMADWGDEFRIEFHK